MTPRIVTIIGTDGSGKTTVCRRLLPLMSERGMSAEHHWLGAESVLMAPVRTLLRKLRPRTRAAATETPGSQQDLLVKQTLAARLRGLTRVFAEMTLFDYRIQLRAKLWRARRCDVVIADRYVFDVAVNLGLTLGWSPGEVVDLVSRELRRVPLPAVRVFVRVPPEVSLQRKDDIPDVAYVADRLSYYDAIASAFGFTVVDGTRPSETTSTEIAELAAEQLRKPYVIYTHANAPDVGGADRVLASMARHMSDHRSVKCRGHRVAVVLRLRTGAVDGHRAMGTPVVLARFARPQVSSGLLSVLRFLMTWPRTLAFFVVFLRRERPDVLHVNDAYDFIPAIAGRLVGVPVVYHLRMISTGVRPVLALLIGRVASRTVSVSAAVRDAWFPSTTAPSEGGHRVVHDLGDQRLMLPEAGRQELRPDCLPDRGRLVVMIGRVEPWKGQHVFLDAVSRLSEEVRTQHVFALVGGAVPGRAQYWKRIVEQAEALGVATLGERSDIPQILRAADVSVHCSVEPDPFPGVVVESMLAGTGTVAADAGGVREMIDDTACGVRVTPDSPDELARVLTELLSDPRAPRDRFGQSARARALALVDPSIIDGEICGIYAELAPTDAPLAAVQR